MSEDDVKAFLNYPTKPLVEFALTLVNLTWQERAAIELCAIQNYTQERAAEKTGCSPDAMQRWYRAAIKKLCAAWSGCAWISKIIK